MKTRLYFDYAAATPLDQQVAEAIDNHRSYFSNPSARYASAREAKKILELSRKQIAISLNCNKDEIVFTSSSTESNNLAIFGISRKYQAGRIISLGTEHPSVYEPLVRLEKEGFKIDWCNVDKYGRIDLEHFKKLIKADTILVTIQYANSTTGIVQQISKIRKVIDDIKTQGIVKPILHIDATGAFSTLHISVDRLGVDLMTLSSSKIYGPASGLLYVRRGVELEPMLYGGKQESGIRAGTQDLASIVGFAKAVEILDSNRARDAEHYQKLYHYFLDRLSEKLDISIFGHPKERIYNIANIGIDNVNGEDLVAYLDAMGIELSTGAACLANNEKPTRILLAMGVEESLAQGSIRVSFGRSTTIEDIDILVGALQQSVNKLRV